MTIAQEVTHTTAELATGGSHTTPAATMKTIAETVQYQRGEVVWEIGFGTGTFAVFQSLMTGSQVIATETSKFSTTISSSFYNFNIVIYAYFS
jgi:precorrin-6B methylase 2